MRVPKRQQARSCNPFTQLTSEAMLLLLATSSAAYVAPTARACVDSAAVSRYDTPMMGMRRRELALGAAFATLAGAKPCGAES